MTHTIGLWSINTIGEVCTRDNIICTVHGFEECVMKGGYPEWKDEVLGNAAILRAAPTLYAAVNLVIATMNLSKMTVADFPEEFLPALAACRKALNRANDTAAIIFEASLTA